MSKNVYLSEEYLKSLLKEELELEEEFLNEDEILSEEAIDKAIEEALNEVVKDVSKTKTPSLPTTPTTQKPEKTKKKLKGPVKMAIDHIDLKDSMFDSATNTKAKVKEFLPQIIQRQDVAIENPRWYALLLKKIAAQIGKWTPQKAGKETSAFAEEE